MKKRISYFLLSVVALIFVASCGSSNNNNEVKCFGSDIKKANGKCKTIKVKASPNDVNDKRMITLHYSIIPALNKESKKEPIIFLTGGPGPSSTTDFDTSGVKPLSDMTKNRDVIVMDYRGTGFSDPYPRCDSLLFEQSIDIFKACHDKLKEENIKLSDYTTANIAYDLNKILKQENIQKAVLMGFSYGTRVATTMARDYPHKVSAMILDGFFSIEANGFSQASESTLEKLNDLAIKYDKAYPLDNFRDKLEKLHDTMSKNINKYRQILVNDLAKIAYEDNAAILAKKIIENPKNIERSLSRQIDGKYSYRFYSPMMYYSIVMQEEYFFYDRQKPFRFDFKDKTFYALKNSSGLRPLNTSFLDSLKEFFPNNTSDKEMQPLKSSIPTIIFTGGLDFNTPKYWASNAQNHLSNSRQFFFKKEGHVLSPNNNEAIQLIRTFLKDYDLNILSEKGDEFIQIKP